MATAITQKYVNRVMFSDIDPFEIVRVISERTLEVRRMNATLTEISANAIREGMAVGGFAAHLPEDVKQEYVYTSDVNAPTFKIYRRKDGRYYNGCLKYVLSDSPYKNYDYNF